MAGNKTRPTAVAVADFLQTVQAPGRRRDAQTLCALMARLSGEPPTMWGASMVGFGRYHYRYDSGREGEMFRVGFSPRKADLVVYLIDGFSEQAALLAKLGNHRTGRSCLYLKDLEAIDINVLETLISQSLATLAARYPAR